jgi:hypothetical protein
MRIIYDGTNEEGGDGSLEFEWRGHHYHIGESEDGNGFWFQRQSMEDFENQTDGWEEATWHSTDNPPFKFFEPYNRRIR